MERKLVKQGHNALTVTLPAKWIQTNQLTAGDLVNIDQVGSNIQISTNAQPLRSTEIDLTNATKPHMWHLFQAVYIKGYDEITIHHDNPKFVEEVVKTHIGMVLISNTKTKALAKSIVGTPESDLDSIIRRIFFMLKELVNLAVETNEYETVKDQEHLLDSMIRYGLRYITKYYKEQDAYRHFYLLMLIEEYADQVCELAKENTTKKQQDIIKHTLSEYITCVQKKEFKRIYTLLKKTKTELPKKTYVDGILVNSIELLYNFLAYVIEE